MQLRLDPKITYAVALEGGGAKGSYQIGAWRALKEAGIRIGAVAGTSVGALNGALIVMDDLSKAENIWANIHFSQVMDVDDETMSKLLRGDIRDMNVRETIEDMRSVIRQGGLDVTPLRNWIREVVDEKAVQQSETELYIVTCTLPDGREHELRAKDLGEGELWDMLLASAYLPVFKGEKLGGKRYADGGLRDVLPIHALVQNGWRDIIALRLFGVGIERPTRIPRDTRVFTVAPEKDLGSTLQFEPEQSRRNMTLGYYDTLRFLYGLQGRDYYIDSQWSEERAFAFLVDSLHSSGCCASLRQMCEKIFPAMGKKLSSDDDSYTGLVLAILDRAAGDADIDPWQVLTEDALLSLLRGSEALENIFSEATRSFLETDFFRTNLMHPLRSLLRPETGDGELRVCLLNDSFPPVVDGVANTVLNYARVLTETEGGCAVVTPEYPGAEDNYPFPVVRYPSLDTTRLAGYRAGMPFDAPTLARLSSMDFNVIHTHCPVMSTMLARSLRETVNAPVVFTYHTKFDIDINKAIKGKMMQEAAIRLLVGNISACDEVWVVSSGAGENLRSLGYRGDYIVMPNGVDLPRGRASEQVCAALSRQWDLPEGVPVYLFVGRIMWYKGLHILLDGLKRVLEAGQDFRMVFVGDGQDRADVEAEAQALGLFSKCRFVGAERDREVIRSWYSRADLLLFPSTFDTNGLVVREAAACDLAALLIRGSCAAEGITDGRTGILIEENGEALAQALLAPDASTEKFRTIGHAAGQDIYVSWDDSIARAREQYRDVLRRWNTGELRRKRSFSDPLFEMSGGMGELLADAKAQRQETLQQISHSLEKARERLERYM